MFNSWTGTSLHLQTRSHRKREKSTKQKSLESRILSLRDKSSFESLIMPTSGKNCCNLLSLICCLERILICYAFSEVALTLRKRWPVSMYTLCTPNTPDKL